MSATEAEAHETARLERQYAEDYAARSQDLASTLASHVESPLSLDQISITGTHHTRPGFLAAIVAPHVQHETKTLGDVLKTTRDVSDALRAWDIFKSVDAGLEEAQAPMATSRDVDLIIKTQEKGRLYLKTSTDVGNGEGSATVTGRVRNLFGGAETLEAYAAYGTRTKSAYHLSFTTPLTFLGLTPNPQQLAELSAYAQTRDLTTFASCKEQASGVSAKLRSALWNQRWTYESGWEGTARQLCEFEPFASIAMRQSAGAHLRSAWVSRLDYLSESGWRSSISSEYAGLGGDAHHFKIATSHSSTYILSAVHDLLASFSFHTGFLLPFSGTPTHFSDKFRLGGPTSVRGFAWNQLGPKSGADYLGGELSYSAGTSLFAPFPFKPEWPLKSHFWLNAGSLANWTDKGAKKTLENWITRPTVSAGLGFMYSNGALRAEVNFGVPLVAHKTDGKRPGIQLGIGIEFL